MRIEQLIALRIQLRAEGLAKNTKDLQQGDLWVAGVRAYDQNAVALQHAVAQYLSPIRLARVKDIKRVADARHEIVRILIEHVSERIDFVQDAPRGDRTVLRGRNGMSRARLGVVFVQHPNRR